MRPRIVLDPDGDNEVEPGYKPVRDQVTFLGEVGRHERLFVQGKALYQWAVDLAQARGWEFEVRESPVKELSRVCPELSRDELRALVGQLGELPGRLDLLGLASRLWPELALPEKPCAKHAWDWLLWRVRTSLPEEQETVLRCVARCYQAGAGSPLSAAYATEQSDAWRIIKEWLGIKPTDLSWPDVPAPLSDWATERLTEEWRVTAVESQGGFFSELLQQATPKFVLDTAAKVAAEYYSNNPNHLSVERLQELRHYLPVAEWRKLQSLVPPEDPGFPPINFPDLVNWFTERYLKFRRWKGAQAHDERVREIGLQFGLWYLGYYADARAAGPGAEYLSWSKTAALASGSDAVTLLVVLDGLGYVDAEYLTSLILEKPSRLALDDFSVALAPVPTVTHFAKKALFTGVTPVYAFDEEEIGTLERRDLDVISALNAAKPGNLVIWSLLEPDKTYHTPQDSDTVRLDVEGRLYSLSHRIKSVVHQVEDVHKLRVVISTDHGRLLSVSRRVHPVPREMIAHGRAAWGRGQIAFDKGGVFVEGYIAYLHPDRFGLPEMGAVILSDEAFMTQDGRSGVEAFPHGGVFPEEVLIPWVQMTRDRDPVGLVIRITGSGVAGVQGQLVFNVTNTSQVRVRVVQLLIPVLHIRIGLDLEVPPFKVGRAEHTLQNWPNSKDLEALEATVIYELPSGERYSERVTPELAVEEMYSRDDIMNDLL